ncbi:MAG: hypothetical protein JW984_01175 [Deltaproteobacteria bacterium]|uniref:Uncharacterized protein n=1 Tax=Candidatus Zymogenus saltonus TaxID=2844893 RepID=A0A9D8KBV1_9DELT|nr:hypothetical protein [Candidatus Zymogenus saltonus]
MKRKLAASIVLISLFLIATISLAGGMESYYKMKGVVKKDGVDTYGQVFKKATEPSKYLVLAGDVAFLVDVTAETVHDVAVNSVDDKVRPAKISIGIISEVSGANFRSKTEAGRLGFSFSSKGSRYVVVVE